MGMPNKATVRAHDAVDAGETLASGSEKLLEATSRYIAAHPLRSLGLALAAGYLLSRLTR